MRFIKIKDNYNNKYIINIDKIISINLIVNDKEIDINTQEKNHYYIRNKNEDKLQEIYKDILKFCISDELLLEINNE